MKGGKNMIIEPHRTPGVFVARGKDDALLTKNMVLGESVYGEKRITVEEGENKIEYRMWNPFRSKLGAAILGGIDDVNMKPGSKVLYLGAASGTSVSHVSDIVGEDGLVYAVEFSSRSGRDLLNMAKKRTNVIPIIEDARHPHKYRMLVGMVDTIFADVAQPDQARIVALNAHNFLKNSGFAVVSIKVAYQSLLEMVYNGCLRYIITKMFNVECSMFASMPQNSNPCRQTASIVQPPLRQFLPPKSRS